MIFGKAERGWCLSQCPEADGRSGARWSPWRGSETREDTVHPGEILSDPDLKGPGPRGSAQEGSSILQPLMDKAVADFRQISTHTHAHTCMCKHTHAHISSSESRICRIPDHTNLVLIIRYMCWFILLNVCGS